MHNVWKVLQNECSDAAYGIIIIELRTRTFVDKVDSFLRHFEGTPALHLYWNNMDIVMDWIYKVFLLGTLHWSIHFHWWWQSTCVPTAANLHIVLWLLRQRFHETTSNPTYMRASIRLCYITSLANRPGGTKTHGLTNHTGSFFLSQIFKLLTICIGNKNGCTHKKPWTPRFLFLHEDFISWV